MFCKNCGTVIDGSNYCPKCGTPVTQTQEQPQPQPEKPVQQPVFVQQNTQNDVPVQEPVKVSTEPVSPSEANSVFRLGILSMICVFIPFFLAAFILPLANLNTSHLSNSAILGILSIIPIGSVAGFVLSLFGKIKSSSYIKTYGQYPSKVKAGRILSNIAMPFSIFFMVFSFFIFFTAIGNNKPSRIIY